MTKTHPFFAVACCAALVALAACATAADDPPALRVGHVGHDHQLALYVAALRPAMFRERFGLHLQELKAREVYDLVENGRAVARLHLVKVGGGSLMPAAMSRGELDVGLGSSIAVAKFADDGQPLKIICPLQTDGDMLAVHRDLPISDWASFVRAARDAAKPLKIGYKAPTAVAKMIFERALKAEGIAYGYDTGGPGLGVVLLNFGSEKSPLPLLEGRVIDGFVMNQPEVAVAVHRGLAKIVADLCDLPPKGKWKHHPCCIVAARTEALERQPAAVKALLKLILLGTQCLREDQALGIDCACAWTKHERAVEAASVPTVNYIAEPTSAWLAGMETWVEMMREIKFFTGRYANRPPEEVVKDLCQFDLQQKAAAELRARGWLK